MDYQACGLKDGELDTPNIETPEECQLLCQATAGCLGFTWVRDWHKCHLKECLPIPIDGSKIGCVSGPRICGNCHTQLFSK